MVDCSTYVLHVQLENCFLILNENVYTAMYKIFAISNFAIIYVIVQCVIDLMICVCVFA